MANEFVAKNGLISQNNTTVSGSLIVTQGITGSLLGTSSWATNSLTTSLAPNYVLTSATSSMLAPYLLTSQTSSMLTPYLLSSQTSSFITNTQTSSFVTNAQTSSMLAPYLLSSQTSSFVTNAQTSSMTVATSSWATNALTASYISPTFISASAAASGFGSGGSVDTGSLLITASASSNVITFTKGDGTPFSITVDTGSGGSPVDTSIFVTTASFNSYTGSSSSQFAGTASYAITASYAMNGGGGGGGGISQGQAVAIVTGYSNLF